MKKALSALVILVALVGLGFGASSCEPKASVGGGFHVYLTWTGEDTSRTMTVLFHDAKRGFSNPQVRWDTESRGGDPALYRNVQSADSWEFEDSEFSIHSLQLTALTPGTTYYFAVGDEKTGFSPERKFRTIPDDASPLRFVVGGDMDVNETVPVLLKRAAALEPQFALIGGDIARDNGKLSNFPKWDIWLKYWEEQMVTPQGYTVPMVLAIGNHEVRGLLGTNAFVKAPFYIGLFRQEGDKTYFSRNFGSETVVHVLDTGHIASHDGEQKEWLLKQLTTKTWARNRFALYHVPLYPSYREYNGRDSREGREHWLPLFDAFGLTAGFESNDHALKRTKMLYAGKEVSTGGTVYFGDGAWGVNPRAVTASGRPYLAHVSPQRHFWVVDVNEDGHPGRSTYRAIGLNGEVLDEYLTPR